jgi:outer membrane protein OmpA-like peptidoglycan-associated protein
MLILITSAFALGQTWDNTKGIGLTGSLFKFVGGTVDRAAVGNSGGLSLRYGVSPYVLFDLNMNYGSFKPTREGSRFRADNNDPYRTFLFPATLDLKVTTSPEGKIKPYCFFGAGLLAWDLRDESGEDKSFLKDQEFLWGESVHGETQYNPLFQFGLGFETFLTQGLALDLQAGVLALPYADLKDNVGYNDENSNAPYGRATLSFYFGYTKDTDKDGIVDKKDADPKRPEDFDGFQDEDGAPDYDNDGDGIVDVQDKAPNEAEDKDGFQDDDGVPDLDNDGDGIVDTQDKAPNQAEDFDNFQDDDGAPEADNDGDGILDAADKCPGTDETVASGVDTKENINDYQDDDGCPDVKPMPKLEKKGAKLILKGINFETASAALTKDSYAILDEIIPGLVDNKEVELEIRGYTDSQGSASYNQKLSESRANTVMQYLIQQGVSASRLKAVGYGEKDPIAPNNTAAGRAQNRRIEFVRTR